MLSSTIHRPTPPPNLPPEPPMLPPAPPINKVAEKWRRKLANRRQRKHDNRCTAIVDSGASNIYLTPAAPMASVDGTAPKIQVGTAAGGLQKLSATCDLALPHLPTDFPKTGYVMPEFHKNLVSIGPMCDAGYTVQFTADAVIISNKDAVPVITGWREKTGTRL